MMFTDMPGRPSATIGEDLFEYQEKTLFSNSILLN